MYWKWGHVQQEIGAPTVGRQLVNEFELAWRSADVTVYVGAGVLTFLAGVFTHWLITRSERSGGSS